MKKLIFAAGLIAFASCSHPLPRPVDAPENLIFSGESHFARVRQLTYGGSNAEAYWSFDGKSLTFQHKGGWSYGPDAPECDQVYALDVAGPTNLRRISNGKGRTTCSFFTPNDERIFFSSTSAAGASCPAPPDMSHGYVWPLYDTYQFYTAKASGEDDFTPAEPGSPSAYNAETTICKDGSAVFTSTRDGDPEIYSAKLDSFGALTNVKRITSAPGYSGGAVFSPDCKKIAWRAERPRGAKLLTEFRALLKQGLVKPERLDLWVANADGSHMRQVTDLGVASFAPAFTPDGARLIFSANLRDARTFDLYRIKLNGTELERVSFANGFDSFPMFSPDGRQLAFASSRGSKTPHETNIFVADWVDQPAMAPIGIEGPADKFQGLVSKLSQPEFEGRGAGTAGGVKAETFVAQLFGEVGLKPFAESFPKAKQQFDGFLQSLRYLADGKEVEGRNVVGVWGNACKSKPPVVVGAHLDHLGFGSRESLEPSGKGLHPGADDNASGVAGMLEAAREIMDNAHPRQSCFVFAAFTGEEAGIAGSSRLAKTFTEIGVHPKAMLNLDMVGRMENDKLIVFGTDSAREWRKLVADECAAQALDCPGGGDGYGPSDHMAFYITKVPVLHFFTGPHLDYHRTTDTADKINATGGVQAANTVAALALKAADTKLTYQKASAAPMMGNVIDRSKPGPLSRAYLGTIPDYSTLTSPHGPGGGSAPGGGVRLAGTRPGSPADRAGVKEGDVLRAIVSSPSGTAPAELLTDTLDDFTAVLAQLKPGDAVTLKIQRDGKILALPAVIGQRQ